MGWRTVIIKERCQLSHKLDYLTIKCAEQTDPKNGIRTERIYLDEIDCIIVESCASFFNTGLAAELARRKIAVVFCDRNHNPDAQLLPLSGTFDVRRKICEQLAWDDDIKDALWQQIICAKIERQAAFLRELGYGSCAYSDDIATDENAGTNNDVGALCHLASTVLPGDPANAEAQAARRYFARLFGIEFNRRDMSWEENGALNYGYAVLLSAFNRAVVANGCLTQLGIHHIGNENAFNLSCDLMEPFRPLVDRHIFSLRLWDLSPASKVRIVDVMNTQVIIEGNKQYLANAIAIYCKNALDALNTQNQDVFTSYEFDSIAKDK
ncbi:MAG: type II CRISPR-associated endonuclease Cas1 [Coriobacteriales bacterium]|jgi:CRISPR-associated endonuclease Cas1 subtype II|nr:type II CRISPR-associated endonuclease Cas1 [Coriobacteriales bacterium]